MTFDFETNQEKPPFSRIIAVDDVREAGLELTLTADEVELMALAFADGLESVDSFEARYSVRRKGRDKLYVKGVVTARINQICVVSLEPFTSELTEEFEVDFVPEEEALAAHEKAAAEIEAAQDKVAALAAQPDPPDPIINGRVDLGVLATEFFVLGLDPYPHKPGVEFKDIVSEDEDEKDPRFAALEKLKPKV